MRFALGIVLAATALTVSGCNYDILKDNGRPDPKPTFGPEKATTSIDFAQIQTKILTPYCVECHKQGEDGEDGGIFTDFAGVMKTITPGNCGTSKFWTALKGNGGKMPKEKNALSSDELAMIYSWIEGGAPEKLAQGTEPAPSPAPYPTTGGTLTPEPQPQPPATTTEPTWSSIESNVIATKCLKCHSGATPKGLLDLTSYDAMMKSKSDDPAVVFLVPGDASKSAIATEIADAKMPPPKAVKAGKVLPVTPEELTAIQAWINAGAHP